MMKRTFQKRLHQHGGSKALDLPATFVRKMPTDYVDIEEREDCLIIRINSELDSLESEPLFTNFINTILADAMEHPEKLKDIREIWDSEWDDLLKGVSEDENN